jgi:hypothetical protein
MALIDDVKAVIRVNSSTQDIEIENLISACMSDLLLSGVTVTNQNDPLIKRAIMLYVKTHFGYDNPDAERLQQAYLLLKTHLSLAEDYTGDDE